MKKNILILYDERSTHTNTVREHLLSFRDFSRHKTYYTPATNLHWPYGSRFTAASTSQALSPRKWDFSAFDVVVVHYSVRQCLTNFIAPEIEERLISYNGPKILFIQDEYDHVDVTRSNIDKLGFSAIFTCVPKEGLEYVYEATSKRSRIEFIQTLTGFVPYHLDPDKFARPLAERSTLVCYRGRRLPHRYGLLGHDKYFIGQRFKQELTGTDLQIDVETDDSKRIYGSWYEFLGSARATLGSESGCNIFDFDGSLQKKSEELSGREFEDVYEQHFAAHEGVVRMNQISPKFFEAIMLRTALVCFPGEYSGILKPNIHYIPLQRDFSNLGNVIEKLQDLDYIKALTDRAYHDIIDSGNYSYASFISRFDDWLDRRLPPGNRTEIISTPIGVVVDGEFNSFGHQSSSDFLLNDMVLTNDLGREQFSSTHETKPEMTNCACLEEGASIASSSPFYLYPHDVDGLLRERQSGSYAAECENPGEHFIEIDLGAMRIVSEIVLEWLDSTNLGASYVLRMSNDRNDWVDVWTTQNNSEYINRLTGDLIPMRYVRLEVDQFLGQQRILLRRFEVWCRPYRRWQ